MEPLLTGTVEISKWSGTNQGSKKNPLHRGRVFLIGSQDPSAKETRRSAGVEYPLPWYDGEMFHLCFPGGLPNCWRKHTPLLQKDKRGQTAAKLSCRNRQNTASEGKIES